MPNYFTPGVYVEEISTLPATVVRVATAVPVFIGYTELAGPAPGKAVKIKSMVSYHEWFGGEPTTEGRSIAVQFDADWQPETVTLGLDYYLYSCLRHYYANGGGDAYILSVGTYSSLGPAKTALINALAELEEADEPTLVLVPDAYAFTNPQDLGDVQVQVLAHCAKMKDRFAILDVLHDPLGNGEGDDALTFRNKIGSNNLSYGAAYYPELRTTIGPVGDIVSSELVLTDSANAPTTLAEVADELGETTGLEAHGQAMNDILALQAALEGFDADWNDADAEPAGQDIVEGKLAVLDNMAQGLISMTLTNPDVIIAKNAVTVDNGPLNGTVDIAYNYFQALLDGPSTGPIAPPPSATFIDPGNYPALYSFTSMLPLSIYGSPPADWDEAADNSDGDYETLYDAMVAHYQTVIAAANLELLAEDELVRRSAAYAGIIDAIRATGFTLPPCGAMAGIYATIDASRGAWKAPANVSLNAVADVARRFQATELDDLNMPDNGKAINAIRPFRGQGILVYGARTLNGNSNEWRYVNVRRLFIMAEESISKATAAVVFEPNDGNTWTKMKGMIENFLNGLWADGALAGTSPKDAFYVKVGLGQTMDAQDILEGRLIVEIGMAVVRPAEFVILKFSHKMQES
jgi:uncharacterized protein